MKFVTIRSIPGSPGKVYYPLGIQDAPIPTPQGRQVLIEMAAAALNHRDFFIRQHLYPGTTFGIPLLGDGAGIVVAAGEDASPEWLHKRVIINPGIGWKESLDGPEDLSGWYSLLGGTKYYKKGTLTEYIIMDEDQLVETPDHLTDCEAAALPIAGLTAWRALVTKAGDSNIQSGCNVLITGIGGGVALMVLSFAVAHGINVWVTSSSGDKIKKAVSMGARGGVSYRKEDWEKDLANKLPTQRPYLDAIIDGAGGDIVTKGTHLLKVLHSNTCRALTNLDQAGGAIVVYGMTIAPQMDFLMKAVLKNIEVRGSTMGSFKEFHDMVSFVKKTGIRPVIAKVVEGIENIPAIDALFEDMGRGNQFGKLVVKIKPDLSCASKL